jgi:hypothetical protein
MIMYFYINFIFIKHFIILIILNIIMRLRLLRRVPQIISTIYVLTAYFASNYLVIYFIVVLLLNRKKKGQEERTKKRERERYTEELLSILFLIAISSIFLFHSLLWFWLFLCLYSLMSLFIGVATIVFALAVFVV